jgi:hypothetical protein
MVLSWRSAARPRWEFRARRHALIDRTHDHHQRAVRRTTASARASERNEHHPPDDRPRFVHPRTQIHGCARPLEVSHWGPLGDHTSCTKTYNPHVGRSRAQRLRPDLPPRDRSSDRNEQHRATLQHHPANAACPRRAVRSGTCTHLLIAGPPPSKPHPQVTNRQRKQHDKFALVNPHRHVAAAQQHTATPPAPRRTAEQRSHQEHNQI